MYDGVIDPATIISRWRSIALERHMVMLGARVGSIEVVPNKLCAKYLKAALDWAQMNLVPCSTLADCGWIGEFDLKKAPDAELLHEQLRDGRVYYRL
jgi:S-ribosylhomocysteine lyase LuxS involved in autoinducer biosynthesis